MTEFGRKPEKGAYYAAFLALRGRRCVVIGGGTIAERKLRGLLEAGADDVLLVSPELTDGIQELAASERLMLARRSYRESDLEDAWMVFACTNDEGLNAAIALAAERNRIWCNVADNAASGSIVSPSVVRRGDLLLAVTASGASPSLSIAIKRELERQYGPRYEAGVERLRALREYAQLEQSDDNRRRAILGLAAEDIIRDDKDAGKLGIELWHQSLLERTKGRQT